MTAHEDDQELRAMLAAADPASALPAADPAGVARLMEDAMSETPDIPETPQTAETAETRSDHLRGRSRLTWLVAAAAAIVIVGGVAFAVADGDGSDAPVAADGPPRVVDSSGQPADTGDAPTITELSVPDAAPSARCLTPQAAPQVVAAQDLVVDAVVESISGGIVTLTPTRFYAGEETDLVTVTEPSGDLQLLLTGVDFTEGGRYLVSASDGQVTLCGFSAQYSSSLAAVYDEAFSG